MLCPKTHACTRHAVPPDTRMHTACCAFLATLMLMGMPSPRRRNVWPEPQHAARHMHAMHAHERRACGSGNKKRGACGRQGMQCTAPITHTHTHTRTHTHTHTYRARHVVFATPAPGGQATAGMRRTLPRRTRSPRTRLHCRLQPSLARMQHARWVFGYGK
jgi:hypothetical protein